VLTTALRGSRGACGTGNLSVTRRNDSTLRPRLADTPGVKLDHSVSPVLVIGARGMLGRAVVSRLLEREIVVDTPPLATLDLAKDDTIALGVGARRRLVINCAAYTDVDGAEASEELATTINGHGVSVLAGACRNAGALLVTYSTDYVFNGAAATPYQTDQALDPLNAYGRSKAAGERALAAAGGESLNIRTSWLYAPWAKNFVRTIAAAARARPLLRVVHDQRGRPTSAEHLARASLRLIEAGATGNHHVTDGGECTWFELATEIVRLAGLAGQCKVEPCTTAEFPRLAKRPAYSVLDLSKTEAILGPMPHWTQNLADVMRRLES